METLFTPRQHFNPDGSRNRRREITDVHDAVIGLFDVENRITHSNLSEVVAEEVRQMAITKLLVEVDDLESVDTDQLMLNAA